MIDESPWLIVHRAGRDARRWRRALASPADHLEIDVWAATARGRAARAESRHDPTGRAPFLTRPRRFLLRPRLRRLWLADLRAPGRIFLDVRDPDPRAIDAVLAALDASASRHGAAASTTHWEQLDRLAARAPEIARFYSIGRRDDMDAAWSAYRRRIADGRAGAGVAIHHSHATRARLQELHEAGLRAVCFTINDAALGVRLVDAGAGGLTSDRLDLIAGWRDRWPRER